MSLDVDVRGHGTTVVLALAGELDLASAPDLEAAVREREETAETILLDLRGLSFMDSSGLRVILGADARARSRGARLALVPGPPGVQRVFQLTLLDARLEFVEDPSIV
jgi:anti-anti-sigma factor